ncbi:MAG: hypothetical protein AW09_003857 [Candidatus Accumulibacter phosphatis]|uniref:Uncharacterized protein n=1 Tax=Candidatus Accumulibacter phosphatis TaxID=327160 RepID=A0A080LRX6_9PROT|nr:MAG: hypothetical protein AW09_003857 [Candidatus Accumulibacter phosphatis]
MHQRRNGNNSGFTGNITPHPLQTFFGSRRSDIELIIECFRNPPDDFRTMPLENRGSLLERQRILGDHQQIRHHHLDAARQRHDFLWRCRAVGDRWQHQAGLGHGGVRVVRPDGERRGEFDLLRIAKLDREVARRLAGSEPRGGDRKCEHRLAIGVGAGPVGYQDTARHPRDHQVGWCPQGLGADVAHTHQAIVGLGGPVIDQRRAGDADLRCGVGYVRMGRERYPEGEHCDRGPPAAESRPCKHQRNDSQEHEQPGRRFGHRGGP